MKERDKKRQDIREREVTLEICNSLSRRSRDPRSIAAPNVNSLFERYSKLPFDYRFYVMHRISAFKTPVARKFLRKIIEKDGNILVRHEAAFALGDIGRPRDLVHIRRALLQDKNQLVRHEAAMALGVLGRRADIRVLRSGLKDKKKMVADSCRAAITVIEMRHYVSAQERQRHVGAT